VAVEFEQVESAEDHVVTAPAGWLRISADPYNS
jgi:hypothetical protein